MTKLALLSCAAALTGMVFLTTDAVVSEAGAHSPDAHSREKHCHRIAKRRSKRKPSPAATAIGAGLGSAALGALIGGIADGNKGAGKGAIIGGSVGVLSGALVGSADRKRAKRAYRKAYRRCMATYRPVSAEPEYDHAPEPWTDEWYDYCRHKYRSFNPETGRYRAYSGRYRLCR